MKPYMLIYDLFDSENYGLYDRETVERVAGIVVITHGDGSESYEGHAHNLPRLESRTWESLDEFADRLYALFTSIRARTLARMRAEEGASLDLFS